MRSLLRMAAALAAGWVLTASATSPQPTFNDGLHAGISLAVLIFSAVDVTKEWLAERRRP